MPVAAPQKFSDDVVALFAILVVAPQQSFDEVATVSAMPPAEAPIVSDAPVPVSIPALAVTLFDNDALATVVVIIAIS